MNWKIFILILVAVVHGYRLLLQLVQYRSANNPTPKNVEDVYDAQTYQRWKCYSAEKCRLELVSILLSLAVTLVLLICNVHSRFAACFPDGGFWQLLAVLLLQTVVDAILGAACGYVENMIIEQKYGFNRSTLKTFITDQIRSLVLELLLSLCLVGALIGLYETLGDWVVLLFTAFLFGFSLLMSFLYPIFSRLGNRFTPLEEGELREKLMGLLTKHGYRVKAIEVMDASRRTTKLNAYFTGFGKMKTIVLYDNLCNTMSTDEICAVFAHELGHGLHKDVPKQQALNLVNLVLMSVAAWLVIREPVLHTAFGFAGVNYGFAYLLLGTGLGLIQPLTGMLTSAYSRRAEYRADRQAVEEGYGPALTLALKKLGRENFSHLAPAKVLVVLAYSHPPLSQRIEAIEQALEGTK